MPRKERQKHRNVAAKWDSTGCRQMPVPALAAGQARWQATTSGGIRCCFQDKNSITPKCPAFPIAGPHFMCPELWFFTAEFTAEGRQKITHLPQLLLLLFRYTAGALRPLLPGSLWATHSTHHRMSLGEA